MSAVISFVIPKSGGAGSSAVGAIRKKEVISVAGTSTITANAGEFAYILNTETSAVLAAYGSTPDAQAATATSATTAGIGVVAGGESVLLGPLAEGDKVNVNTVA